MLDNGRVTTHDTQAAPPRRIAVLIAVAVVVIAIDQIAKVLVVAHLEGKPPTTVIPGLVYLDVIRNSGAAFSMATGLTWVFSLVAIAVAVAIVWVAPRLRSVGWAIGLGLVLAGALGNLIDRLFRAPAPLRGHVVDFISLFHPLGQGFAVFNLADSSITIGGVLIVLLALLGKDYDGGVSRRTTAPAGASAQQPETALNGRDTGPDDRDTLDDLETEPDTRTTTEATPPHEVPQHEAVQHEAAQQHEVGKGQGSAS
jgi:signal peptidase II